MIRSLINIILLLKRTARWGCWSRDSRDPGGTPYDQRVVSTCAGKITLLSEVIGKGHWVEGRLEGG